MLLKLCLCLASCPWCLTSTNTEQRNYDLGLFVCFCFTWIDHSRELWGISRDTSNSMGTGTNDWLPIHFCLLAEFSFLMRFTRHQRERDQRSANYEERFQSFFNLLVKRESTWKRKLNQSYWHKNHMYFIIFKMSVKFSSVESIKKLSKELL